MAKEFVRYDSKKSRRYLESLVAIQQERRNNEKAQISKELYLCRDGDRYECDHQPLEKSLSDSSQLTRLTRILRRAGVIDDHNNIFVDEPKTNSEHGDDETI